MRVGPTPVRATVLPEAAVTPPVVGAAEPIDTKKFRSPGIITDAALCLVRQFGASGPFQAEQCDAAGWRLSSLYQRGLFTPKAHVALLACPRYAVAALFDGGSKPTGKSIAASRGAKAALKRVFDGCGAPKILFTGDKGSVGGRWVRYLSRQQTVGDCLHSTACEATVLCCADERYYLAHRGPSRAVLVGHDGSAQRLTASNQPTQPAHAALAPWPNVASGELASARAFVIASPDFWRTVSEAAAADLVKRRLDAGESDLSIAGDLADWARSRCSASELAVSVVFPLR